MRAREGRPRAHLRRSEDGEQLRQHLACDRKELIFGQVDADKVEQDSHASIDSIGRPGGADESEQLGHESRPVVRPVGVSNVRDDDGLFSCSGGGAWSAMRTMPAKEGRSTHAGEAHLPDGI